MNDLKKEEHSVDGGPWPMSSAPWDGRKKTNPRHTATDPLVGAEWDKSWANWTKHIANGRITRPFVTVPVTQGISVLPSGMQREQVPPRRRARCLLMIIAADRAEVSGQWWPTSTVHVVVLRKSSFAPRALWPARWQELLRTASILRTVVILGTPGLGLLVVLRLSLYKGPGRFK